MSGEGIRVRTGDHHDRVRFGDTLYPYDPDRCCPACGHTEVTTHLRGGCANVGCRSCPPLHLLRVCEWWRYDGCRQTDCTWPSCAVLDKGELEPCA